MTNVKKSIIRFAALLLAVMTSPVYAQISGHLTVCRGASRTTLTGTPGGGAWSSGDVSHATIDASTGEVTGVAAGTATITYTDPSTTVHTAVVTVNSYVMTAIGFSSGSDTRCTGGVPATCTVSPTNGNNWTSSDPSIATVNTGGLVVPSATNSGTVIISYRHGYGNCYVTRGVSVNPTPTVSLTNPVCVGVTQTATGTPTGGTWSSTNTSVGTINTTTGVLSSLTGGSAYIRYTAGGCQSQTQLTVIAAPAAITGSTTVCVGNTSTLSSGSSGGTWSSSDPSVATIGSSTGAVTGIITGTTTISYIVGSGCFRTVVVTVNAGPSASAGPDEVCVGQAISLTNATGGGSWSSSNTSKATVTTYGGTVVGMSAGTVNISYRVGGGCASVKTITVNATMASITGGPNVCEGASVTLSHTMSGGTWTASNSHATVDVTTGEMTGVTAGGVNITYTASPGCVKVQSMTVKSTPAAITGALTVCPGATTALMSASGGGTWTSGNTSVATVSSTGVMTGVSGGTATITYTVASWGCSTTAVATVSSTGGSISGSTTLYPGLTSTLTPSYSGGVWSSSNVTVANIGSSTGIVSAVAPGTASITYSLEGCASATVVSVLASPAPIAGDSSFSTGGGDTLTNPVPGGVWSSSNPSVATIGSASGILTAMSPGTSTISYTIGAEYVSTIVVTVSLTGDGIDGTASVCLGTGTTFTTSFSGGSWTSSNTSVATIGASTGIVTSISAGTTTICYNTYSGCAASVVLTVNAVPSAITGLGGTCVGAELLLSNAETGGVWGTGDTSIVAVNSSSGVVSALSAGTATITYTLAGECQTYTTVTVFGSIPPIWSYASGWSFCANSQALVLDDLPGGVWTTSDVSIATIDSFGMMTPLAPGTVTVTYTTGSCGSVTQTFTVRPLPTPIDGSATVCKGGSVTLTNPTSPGTWSTNSPSVVSINPSTGVVSGLKAGTALIYYYVPSVGCSARRVQTVNTTPTGSITGPVSVMVGDTVSLDDTVSGGTWSSSAPSVATVSAAGELVGLSRGTTTISYGVTGICGLDYATKMMIGTPAASGNFPARQFATYLGAEGNEETWSIATDDSGYLYVTGFTESTTGIATAGAYKTTRTGERDVFLAKFTGDGTRVWATYFGGDNDYGGSEHGLGLVVDVHGNIYMSGFTNATAGVTTSGAHQSVFGGGDRDAFVAKFSSSGSLLWSTYFGGGGVEDARVSLHSSGGICLFGSTSSTSGIATSGSHQTAYGGGQSDGYIARFSESGELLWATYYGGSGYDYTSGGSDSAGNIYAGGGTSSYTGIATTGAYSVSGDGGSAFIVKFDSSGVRQWGTYYGGSSYELNNFLAVDRSGNSYIYGITGSTNGIATSGAFIATNQGGGDGFIAKFSNSGIRQWGTYFGGSGSDGPRSVSVDDTGNVFVSGDTQSGTGIATSGSIKPEISGLVGTFLQKFRSDGALLWGTYYGGQQQTKGWANAVDRLGNIYLGGFTTSSTEIVTCDGYDVTFAGNDYSNDIFLVKFGPCVGAPSAGAITGSTVATAGDTIVLSNTDCGGVWSSSNNTVATVTQDGSVFALTGGSAIISYTVSNQCGTTSATHSLSVAASRTAFHETGSDFRIFPNPSGGDLNVMSSLPGMLTIHSIEGRALLQQALTQGISGIRLPNGLVTGIYILTVKYDDGSIHTARLIYQP